MAVVTMRQLLEAGVHFGHQTRRWNPKMKRYIFTERNGIYIVDLQQTLQHIDDAYAFVRETVAHGGSILFIGTKKQAQEAVAEQATRVGMPYVNHRWLGGMLTNFQTVHKRLQRLAELEELEASGGGDRVLTKKELLVLGREREKLTRVLGGIRGMERTPSAVWVLDTNKEHLAVAEAKKLGIPVVAVLDTNCDPDDVDYAVPGNDDAIRSAAVLTRVIADAVIAGKQQRSRQQAEAQERSRQQTADATQTPAGGETPPASAPAQPAAPTGTAAAPEDAPAIPAASAATPADAPATPAASATTEVTGGGEALASGAAAQTAGVAGAGSTVEGAGWAEQPATTAADPSLTPPGGGEPADAAQPETANPDAPPA